MKKIIYISHFILLISCQAQAQITYQGVDLNEEQLAEGNQEIITNASTIIDGIRLNYKTLSLIKKGEIDRVVLIKLTHIFRSSDIKTGDTIIVIFRNVAHGTDTMYEDHLHSGYPKMFSRTLPDTNIYCELFLTEFTSRVEIGDHLWQNKKVYELYLTKNGYATVYFKDEIFNEAPYDVYALFNLKFKTRQEWYNYLKKYPDIKVPEGY